MILITGVKKVAARRIDITFKNPKAEFSKNNPNSLRLMALFLHPDYRCKKSCG